MEEELVSSLATRMHIDDIDFEALYKDFKSMCVNDQYFDENDLERFEEHHPGLNMVPVVRVWMELKIVTMTDEDYVDLWKFENIIK